MKADQDQLERKLWADREAIRTKYQDKLNMAQTKLVMCYDLTLNLILILILLFICKSSDNWSRSFATRD